MKSKTLSGIQDYLKSSKKLYQNYKDKIIDILLFGSSVKGKSSPNDVDIAIILKNTKEQEIISLIGKFSVYFNKDAHLNLVIIETILQNPILKTLLEEGISLIDQKQLHNKLGYESGYIFSLDLTKLNKSKKVLFSYALHGKKEQKGILKNLNCKLVGRAVFFIPINYVEEFKAFLELWNVDFFIMKVLKSS